MDNEQQKAEIEWAKDFANKFNYDQIIVIGRRVGRDLDKGGEWVTTYGKNAEHSMIAGKIGQFFKYRVMGWLRNI